MSKNTVGKSFLLYRIKNWPLFSPGVASSRDDDALTPGYITIFSLESQKNVIKAATENYMFWFNEVQFSTSTVVVVLR
jgi:hypothetical protein